MNSKKFKIHDSSKIYGNSVIGKDTVVLENVILGVSGTQNPHGNPQTKYKD